MIALQALLLILCGLGIGWAIGRRPDPALVAQLDTLRSTSRQLDAELAAWQAAGPSRDTVIVRQRAAAAAHDTVTVRLIDTLIVVAPDSLVPVLERVRAEHVATVADLNLALDSTSAQLARSDALLARSEQLRAANLALAAKAVHRGGGSPFVLSVGVGATYARGGVALGPTVALGVRVPVF
jgi:hypothetical protein